MSNSASRVDGQDKKWITLDTTKISRDAVSSIYVASHGVLPRTDRARALHGSLRHRWLYTSCLHAIKTKDSPLPNAS
jgi:hypothetical protein